MSARGGTTALYNIFCSHCRNFILLYQKDGAGNLFRLYIERIHSPLKRLDGLSCNSCGASIGLPMIYKPEQRAAFRLIPGAIVKKKA